MIPADVHDLARNATKVIVVTHRGIVSEAGSVAEQVAQGDLALGVLLKDAVDGKVRQVGGDGLDDSGYLLRGWLGMSRGAGQSSHRSSHRQTQNERSKGLRRTRFAIFVSVSTSDLLGLQRYLTLPRVQC